MLTKTTQKKRRAHRVRARINGTANLPRLSVFRSNLHISVQAIDDVRRVTLCSASDMKGATGTKSQKAEKVGKEIAEKLLASGVKQCIFDRGGNLYHGRVKALADSARSQGLIF